MREMKVPVDPDANMEQARYNVPFDLTEEDAIKSITGQAICHVDGVLGLKGTLGDVFKRDNDITRGITVFVNDAETEIKARIIVDAAYNQKQVAEAVQQSILRALYEGAGIQLVQLTVEVDSAMESTAFYEKYGPDRTCSAARN